MACHGYQNCCSCPKCANRQVRKLSPHKDVRAEARMIQSLGFSFMGMNSSGHPTFDHEEFGEIQLPTTPSSRYWRVRFRQRLARMMGLNSHQLDRLIAGQPLQPSTRKQGPGRVSHEAVVIRAAASLGVPCDVATARRLLRRFDGVTGARKALEGMVQAKRDQAA